METSGLTAQRFGPPAARSARSQVRTSICTATCLNLCATIIRARNYFATTNSTLKRNQLAEQSAARSSRTVFFFSGIKARRSARSFR